MVNDYNPSYSLNDYIQHTPHLKSAWISHTLLGVAEGVRDDRLSSVLQVVKEVGLGK